MKIRLIVNADDLGLAPFIDQGIFAAARDGIVTSASVLAMGPSFAQAAESARETRIGIGVHLALSGGLLPAASNVPSLLENGRLVLGWTGFVRRFLSGQVVLDEVERELEAQVVRVLDSGLEIDHVDGHQHLHVLPGILQRVVRLCERHRIWAMRLPREGGSGREGAHQLKRAVVSSLARGACVPGWMRVPDTFHGVAESGRLSQESLLAMLERLGEGTHELGCHPGKGEGVVPEDPGWRSQWSAELAALTSPEVRDVLARRRIALVRFTDL